MIRKLPHIFVLLLWCLAGGCAHTYSEAEYNAATASANECKAAMQKLLDETKNAAKNSSQVQGKLDQTSRELATALMEKQDLLDKNIQCLEEKKILIKQISQSSSLSQEKKDAQQRVGKSYDYVMNLLEAERRGDQLYIIKAQDRIRIVVPQKSLFPTAGSAWLTPRGTRLVKKIASGIKHMAPSSVEVSGHTDNTYASDPRTATYPTNWHLALTRALSVLQVMEEAHVKRDSMYASAYGDTKPIADASTEAGRAMNRRVEISFIP